jgi:glycosyltransferase involved in cell wall biosynthesis
VGNLVDEMIVVDTGSTDRTKEIATAFGAKVFDFPWSNDFSAARNFSLSEAKGNWILVLDADELISPIDHPALLNLIKIHGKKVAYSFVTRNYVEKVDVVTWSSNDGKYEEESGSGWIPSEKVRLFPNDDRVQFENPVHEFVEHSLEKISTLIKKCSIPIHHYGKLNEDKEKKKGEHYYLLGKKKLEESESDIQSIGELAVQAGGLNQFEEAIKLWNRYLTLQPEVPEPYINLSAIYMKMGKYQEAAEYSKKAMALSPETKEGVMNYSLAEFNLGHIEKTICALEDLLSKNPEYPLGLGLLSVAYIIHGEKDKSHPIIEKIRRMGFNYDQYLHNTARELLSLGREEHARWLMDIAGEDNNNNLMVKDQQPINLCEKASGSKSHLKRSNRVETERSS